MQDQKKFLEFFDLKDRFGSFVGHRLVSLSDQECVSELVIRDVHMNPNQVVHGGALFSAMDSAQGALVHYQLDAEFKNAATGTATIKYLAPVLGGRIELKTWIKGKERRKIFVSSQAKDETGKIVAELEEIWIGFLKD